MVRWLVLSLFACSSSAASPEIVDTEQGAVRGVAIGDDVTAWLGIPYAAPPIGELRWAPPAPAPHWSGVRDARSWSPTCIQTSTSNALLGGSEDCLYLNVWAPPRAEHLPVLVFIHGGFALNGSAATVTAGERIYDGAYVAAHGPAVVVTLNYRLGALGWFRAPTLGVNGNFGVADQLAALRWVQTNIAAFGGDPTHVLVYGESAGGTATCAIYASPQGRGLFSAAMIESGGCGVMPQPTIEALGQSLIGAAGCSSAADPLACLRAQPADTVAVAAPFDLADNNARWAMTLDDELVPQVPATAIAAGAHNHVPFAIGNTTNEYSTLISHFLHAPITTDAEYRDALAHFFPQRTSSVLARYPAAAYASPMQALITALSDALMVCPARRIARTAFANQSEPVWRYMFAHTYENGPEQPLGAGHALDLPFEFHNLALTGFTPSATELALSDSIIGYWVRLAATGDPNGNGAVPWPRYTADDPAIVLDNVIAPQTGVRTAQCDFWD